MTSIQKLLLPVALVAGAAVPAVAAAGDGDCVAADRAATVTHTLAEAPGAEPGREAALLSFAASDPGAELRVKLRQDVVRGRDRGGRRAVRVVPVGEDGLQVSVRRPEGGDVAFSAERVRSRPGRLSLELRAVVSGAEGERVRAFRATVHVRAVGERCDDDEAGTTTGDDARERGGRGRGRGRD